MTRRTGLLFTFAFLTLGGVTACQPANDSCPSGGFGGMCIWEGPVSFERTAVLRSECEVFVEGEFTWAPCGRTPGVQDRVYRVDLQTGGVAQVASTPTGATMVSADGDTVRVSDPACAREVTLLATASDSVLRTALEIGTLSEGAAMDVPLEVDSVCENQLP